MVGEGGGNDGCWRVVAVAVVGDSGDGWLVVAVMPDLERYTNKHKITF